MKKSFTIVALIVMSVYCYADDNEEYVVTHPKITPIYFGRTLFCSTMPISYGETPCDPESRLVLYSPIVVDTIQGRLLYRIHFDTINAEVNKELPVLEITDLIFWSCNKAKFYMNLLRPKFYKELRLWHYWLGDYINPMTLYPWQQWTIKFIVIPQ